jgi:hypothetical protein
LEAHGSFKSARKSGQFCSIVNKSEDRVSKIELGNLPPGSEIILTLNMTLIVASSSPNSLFFKFPLESCNPVGVIVTFDTSKLESFLFEQEIEGLQPIASAKSTHDGE